MQKKRSEGEACWREDRVRKRACHPVRRMRRQEQSDSISHPGYGGEAAAKPHQHGSHPAPETTRRCQSASRPVHSQTKTNQAKPGIAIGSSNSSHPQTSITRAYISLLDLLIPLAMTTYLDVEYKQTYMLNCCYAVNCC